ncbi:MAG: hypothetical protein WCJ14_11875 [Verrucomicrobiota bacterium]
MKTRGGVILCCVLGAMACGKVKSVVVKAATDARQKIAGSVGTSKSAVAPAIAVDVELQKLVDQTAEGAIFRKDLPFPTRLDVRATERSELSGRFSQTSPLGRQAAAAKGTRTKITHFERAGDQVRYTLEKSDLELPPPATSEAVKQAPPALAEPPLPPPVTFRKTGKSWGADHRADFHAVALAQELAPAFDQLLIENALAPRPLWFAKHRFRIGDELVVSGKLLPMLLLGNATGSLTLKLESFEPVEGHPCGVFAVTGDYRRHQVPDLTGSLSDEDVTIQTGKLWLSLIYPVIIQQELDTIQSVQAGGHDGTVIRSQGACKVFLTRAWKRLEP